MFSHSTRQTPLSSNYTFINYSIRIWCLVHSGPVHQSTAKHFERDHSIIGIDMSFSLYKGMQGPISAHGQTDPLMAFDFPQHPLSESTNGKPPFLQSRGHEHAAPGCHPCGNASLASVTHSQGAGAGDWDGQGHGKISGKRGGEPIAYRSGGGSCLCALLLKHLNQLHQYAEV